MQYRIIMKSFSAHHSRQLANIGSRIDMQTHAGSMQQHKAVAARVAGNRATDRDGFCNHVTLTFVLLTSGSMHAERLL